jgi:hypothetical protein
MSFQWIFDNAVSINMNRRPIVSQTTSRDQRIRTVSRGGNIWRFTVTMPNGLRWQENRGNMEAVDLANILTTDTVNMSKAAYNYIVGYQGAVSNPGTMTLTPPTPPGAANTFTLGNLPSTAASTVLFKAGDLIQPVGTTHVYSVTADVLRGTGSTVGVPVHRTILEASGSGPYTINVGSAVSWKVICTQCPTWTITPGGLIQWSGPFVFAESLL